MPRVVKTNEKRAEERLRYRWPVRFGVARASCPRKNKAGTASPHTEQKPLAGQMVDLSSKAMAFLFHADKRCPHPDELITTNFGVPHFGSHSSFDTVLFNRIGRVCRVDSLSSRVNRIAVQFAEPLFFKPGEQDVSETVVQQRLEAKARSVLESKATAATSGKATVRAQERAPTKTPRRAKAGKKPQTKADRKGQAQARAAAQDKLRSYAEQIARVRAEAARQIARVTAEASEVIARIEAQFNAKAAADQTTGQDDEQKNTPDDAELFEGPGLMKKVDAFFTDKSRIF